MNRPRRISQAEVARLAGVSRPTASLVLRGGTGPSESTRQSVLAAAAKLGYRPNSLVHSIRSGRSRTIGVLVHPYDSFWTQVLYGIHDRLIEDNILPFILWDREHHGEKSANFALSQIHRMLDRWVDGAILWPYFAQLYSEHVEEFSSRNLPVVTIDHVLPSAARADAVVNDEAAIARDIIDHLAALGHRHLLLVLGTSTAYWCETRARQFAETARRRRPRLMLEQLRVHAEEDAQAALERRLSQESRPTAIIAGTDHYAPGAYAAARNIGLRIPDDVSVVGVGDLAESQSLWPPLTSYHQDGYAIGRQAAELALQRSKEGPRRPYPRLAKLTGALRIRASTKTRAS